MRVAMPGAQKVFLLRCEQAGPWRVGAVAG